MKRIWRLAGVGLLVVGVGTYFQVPPMSTVIDFGESFKDAAAEKYGEPPYGHAELSSLKVFVKKMNLEKCFVEQCPGYPRPAQSHRKLFQFRVFPANEHTGCSSRDQGFEPFFSPPGRFLQTP
jgi:hypothetical protein